jgi:hypothetical protein
MLATLRKQERLRSTMQSCKILPIRDMKSEYNSYLPIVFVLDARCRVRLKELKAEPLLTEPHCS